MDSIPGRLQIAHLTRVGVDFNAKVTISTEVKVSQDGSKDDKCLSGSLDDHEKTKLDHNVFFANNISCKYLASCPSQDALPKSRTSSEWNRTDTLEWANSTVTVSDFRGSCLHQLAFLQYRSGISDIFPSLFLQQLHTK